MRKLQILKLVFKKETSHILLEISCLFGIKVNYIEFNSERNPLLFQRIWF